MGARTLKLDSATARALDATRQATGLQESEIVRRALQVVRTGHAGAAVSSRPYEIFAALDLGPGGRARAPAHRAKSAIRELIRTR